MSKKTVEVIGGPGIIVIEERLLKRYQTRGYELVKKSASPKPVAKPTPVTE